MRRMILALIALAVVGTEAGAQTAATNSSTTPPAIASGGQDSKTSAAPVAGKNSFTRSQVRKRLLAHGYTAVKGLAKDAEGVWRGSAMKNGSQVSVAVDFQGNITEQ